MTINVNMKWRGTISHRARRTIESGVRVALKSYLQHAPLSLTEVNLIALKLAPGADLQKGIKVVPKCTEHEANKDSLLVSIATGTGNQGLVCHMSIAGVPASVLFDLIESGPYNKHRKVSHEELVVEGACTSLMVATCPEPEVVEIPHEVAEVRSAPIVVVAPASEYETRRNVLSISRMSPYEKLKKNSASEEEIERLKATLASIIATELVAQGFTDVPNTLLASVEHITKAIIVHVDPSRNSKGDYQGIIANFYVTRIALFAYKWEGSMDEKALYHDWIFDCELVLDFVGGVDKLKHLAQERFVEVKQREEERKAQEVLPATVQPLEDAVEDKLSDFAILEMAHALMAARVLAQNDVDLAERNEDFQREIVVGLKQKLAEAEKVLDQATEQKLVALDHLEALTLSPELSQKLREIRDRIHALTTGLGI